MLGTGRHEEGIANAAIKPGHLVELMSTGNYRSHATAGGSAERTFALEDALQGKTIADAFAANDQLPMVVAERGDVLYAYLHGGENASIGSKLSSAGNGAMRVVTGSDKEIAVALEAVNASDSNDVDERIRIRII